MKDSKEEAVTLKRSLSLPLMIFYGLGTIIGAGFYALVGKVAKYAALLTPVSFMVAAFIAFFTAISYAELSSRFPVSAGEAFYVKKAFHQKWLSILVGWATILTGIVSTGAIAIGFAGYLKVFVPIPEWFGIVAMILGVGVVAIWGITESAIMAMVITIIEIVGMLIVAFIASDQLVKIPTIWPELIPSMHWGIWSGILNGAFLAFYAFIGFEDMANVAEEVKMPSRTLPIAFFTVMLLATLLYVVVSLVIVLALPMESLSESTAPLALVLEHHGYSPALISVISLIALVNGALIQIIMASRIMYGMASHQHAPSVLGKVHAKTQTPIIATIFTIIITLIFALWLPIETLAKATSAILLGIFILINMALIVIKLRDGKQEGAVSYFIGLPVIGALLCVAFLGIQFVQA